MERSFLEPADCSKLKRFAEVISIQGKMRLITNDAWIRLQMALCNCREPDIIPGEKFVVMLFGDKEWCFVCVRHQGHDLPEDNGLSALRIKRDYLMKQFAPDGNPNNWRMETIMSCLFSILNVDPAAIDFSQFRSFANN